MKLKLSINVTLTVLTLLVIATQSTSFFQGVSWNKSKRKWYVFLHSNGNKIYGGGFTNELDAAKKANQLCEQLGISLKNPEMSAIPTQKNEKTSQYKGVSWNKQYRKWYTYVKLNGKLNYGGRFGDELNAAKRVNQLSEELSIPLQNPGINSIPTKEIQNKTSIYTGVSWKKNLRKWQSILRYKKKQRYGGSFDHEEDAAMKINLLCDEYGIKRKNPTINIKLDEIQQKSNCNIYPSKEENIVKKEEESILYGLKNEYKQNFIKSHDEKIKMKNQKRKRQEDSIIMNNDIKEEKVETETLKYDDN